MTPKLLPHQVKALAQMKNGCVLTGGVGTGKTITSLFYFYEKELGGTVGDYGSTDRKMDLYVFTTARKRDSLDWQQEAVKLGISTVREYSGTGVQLTVDSYNNIGKYTHVRDAFIILDEQRMVGSGAWTKAFLHMAKSNRWIMLSATPGDIWEDYIPLFIANGFYKNRTQFKREHCVYSYYGRFPKLERYLSVGKLVSLRNSIVVEMPYARHTTRHLHTVPVEYDKDLFERVVKKRWHVYEERPLKDVSELFSVMRKVVNSDTSRLTVISDLLRVHPRLIVFYNFDYELEQLRTLVQTNISERASASTKTKVTEFIPSTGKPDMSSSSLMSKSGTKISNSTQSTGSTITLSDVEMLKNGSLDTETSEQSPHISEPQLRTWNPLGSDSIQKTTDSLLRVTEPERTTLSDTDSRSSELWRQNSSNRIDLNTNSPTSPMTNTSGRLCIPLVEGRSEPLELPKTLRTNQSSAEDSFTDSPLIPSKTKSKKASESTELVIAEWNGHRHDPVPDVDRWVYLVQYVAGAEAWNCVETNAVCFYSLTYSYKNFEQAQGRIDRLNTPFSDLEYYILMSKSPIDRAVAKSLKNKQNFNEKDFVQYT